MKNVTIILIIMSFVVIETTAQEQTYNYQRAIELYNNEEYEDAVDYFGKEIYNNEKNIPYCCYYLAIIYYNYYKSNSDALKFINRAIETLPNRNKTWIGASYGIRSDIYLKMEDTVRAMQDIDKAIKIDSKNIRLYSVRASIYINKKEYKLAEADYKKCIELDETDNTGYWGMGNVYRNLKKYKTAIESYTYAIKLEERSVLYLLRSVCYGELKDYDKQTDDLISAIDIREDIGVDYVTDEIANLKEDAQKLIRTKLTIKNNKEPNNIVWLLLLARTYENDKPRKAIEYYDKALKISNNASIYAKISNAYFHLGNYNNALKNINEAIDLDKEYAPYFMTKANILNEMGRSKEAIQEVDKFIETYPEYFWGYYRRGWFKEEIKDYDGAIDDYTIAITLEPGYEYSYSTRGKLYLELGEKELSEKDFKKCIELDNEPGDNSCAMYAYFYLGQKDKAKEFMAKVMANSGKDSSFYDAACIYSLMNEKQKALNYFEKALEKGFRRFVHIERDSDLDNIRNEQKFKNLVNKYKKIADEDNETENEDIEEYIEKISKVPFTRKGRVCEVKAKINDLPLTLIFDTGASDVSISNVEATFMYKNGYISQKDIIGTQYYLNANGEISEGTIINLNKVELGDCTLNNIRASVVKNQNAPLLLGQSVLERFGKIEIDNENKVLKITRKERR